MGPGAASKQSARVGSIGRDWPEGEHQEHIDEDYGAEGLGYPGLRALAAAAKGPGVSADNSSEELFDPEVGMLTRRSDGETVPLWTEQGGVSRVGSELRGTALVRPLPHAGPLNLPLLSWPAETVERARSELGSAFPKASPYATRLWGLVDSAPDEVARFIADGGFEVRNPTAFSELIQAEFKASPSSFARQLNKYTFRLCRVCDTTGVRIVLRAAWSLGAGAIIVWWHPLFLDKRPDLLPFVSTHNEQLFGPARYAQPRLAQLGSGLLASPVSGEPSSTQAILDSAAVSSDVASRGKATTASGRDRSRVAARAAAFGTGMHAVLAYPGLSAHPAVWDPAGTLRQQHASSLHEQRQRMLCAVQNPDFAAIGGLTRTPAANLADRFATEDDGWDASFPAVPFSRGDPAGAGDAGATTASRQKRGRGRTTPRRSRGADDPAQYGSDRRDAARTNEARMATHTLTEPHRMTSSSSSSASAAAAATRIGTGSASAKSSVAANETPRRQARAGGDMYGGGEHTSDDTDDEEEDQEQDRAAGSRSGSAQQPKRTRRGRTRRRLREVGHSESDDCDGNSAGAEDRGSEDELDSTEEGARAKPNSLVAGGMLLPGPFRAGSSSRPGEIRRQFQQAQWFGTQSKPEQGVASSSSSAAAANAPGGSAPTRSRQQSAPLSGRMRSGLDRGVYAASGDKLVAVDASYDGMVLPGISGAALGDEAPQALGIHGLAPLDGSEVALESSAAEDAAAALVEAAVALKRGQATGLGDWEAAVM